MHSRAVKVTASATAGHVPDPQSDPLSDDPKKPVADTRMVPARDILDEAFRRKEVTCPDPGAGV